VKPPIALPICLLSVGLSSAFPQPPSSPYSERHGLQAPMESFELSNATFDDALRNLAAKVRPNAVIGFEPVIAEGGPEPARVTGVVSDGALGDVLALMCAADNRYTYSEVQPGVIEVRPKVENRELAVILNLPIPRAKIIAQDLPSNLIIHIFELLPELGRYLQAKVLAWSQKTGRPLPGSPGITMMSNPPPPEVSIEVQNTTVRGVLDAIGAYSLVHGSKSILESPWVPPTGWRVNFKPDPEAPTGLGGYVSWSRFP
jgi:hypothetical protein